MRLITDAYLSFFDGVTVQERLEAHKQLGERVDGILFDAFLFDHAWKRLGVPSRVRFITDPDVVIDIATGSRVESIKRFGIGSRLSNGVFPETSIVGLEAGEEHLFKRKQAINFLKTMYTVFQRDGICVGSAIERLGLNAEDLLNLSSETLQKIAWETIKNLHFVSAHFDLKMDQNLLDVVAQMSSVKPRMAPLLPRKLCLMSSASRSLQSLILSILEMSGDEGKEVDPTALFESLVGIPSNLFASLEWAIYHCAKHEVSREKIQDSIRLYPTVPVLDRVAVEDLIIGGTEFRKGDLIFISQLCANRNGDDDSKYGLSFLGGSRICPSIKFSLSFMVEFITQLTQYFDLIKPEAEMTVQPFNALMRPNPKQKLVGLEKKAQW